MAIKGTDTDSQFDDRNLRFKNSLLYEEDDEFSVVSVRLSKMRKEALQKDLKVTTGIDLSSFIRILVYEYMDEKEIKPI